MYIKRVFLTVGLTLAAVFIVWYGVKPILEKNAPPIIMPEITTATILKPKNAVTNFSLTDTTNQPFTEKSLLGQWTLMFFGYAQCPEICPKTLITITELWKQVPQDLHFVFVSLDPESDTVQILRDFLGRFNPEFRGLTGEAAVIQKLAKACGIYSWQDPKTNDPSKPKMIDHSATLLLINPQGQLHAVFSPPYHPEIMAKDLKQILSTPISTQ
jgi:protein SCO1/2